MLFHFAIIICNQWLSIFESLYDNNNIEIVTMDKVTVGRAGTWAEAETEAIPNGGGAEAEAEVEAVPSGGGAAQVEVSTTVCPVVGWIRDREIHVRHHITEHITK